MDFQRGYYMGDTPGTSNDYNPLQKQISRIKVNPLLNKYEDLVEDFGNYLEETSHLSFDIYGETYSGDQVVKNIPYIHRWTVIYRKSILAKLYQLENWLRFNPRPITFLSLTTYQSGGYSRKVKGYDLDVEDGLKLLMESYTKLRLMINNRIKGYPVDFFYILEPHKSGYAHMHMIIFDEFTQDEQDKIKKLWSQKYEAGSENYGVDFDFKKPDENIQSIRNYIMKYISKGLQSSGSKYYSESWTPAEAVFNAILWKTNTRLWNCSRNLQKVLKPDLDYEYKEMEDAHTGQPITVKVPKQEPGIMWYKTVLRGVPDRPECPVWISPTVDINGFRTHKGNTGKDILIKFKQMFHSRSSCLGLSVKTADIVKDVVI